MIGAELRKFRENIGMSLTEAASRLCISKGYLSDIEKGHARVKKCGLIYAAALLYGVDADNLFILNNMLPQDVFYKVVQNPELVEVIRAY